MQKIVINSCTNSKCVLTIGSFDGMHLGHQQLLNAVNIIGKKNNLKRSIILFQPYPHEYFCDRNGLIRRPRISFLRDQVALLMSKKLIDEIIIFHFTDSIANLSAADFIEKILIKKLNTTHIVIGENFKFGKNASGSNTDFIKHSINCTVIPSLMINNYKVSSSHIRDLAKQNELQLLKRFLGHNIHYTARVISGKKIGRKHNVATINLNVAQHTQLAVHGIYVAYVYIDGVKYQAVISSGFNPTVCDSETFKLEAHLLNENLNLYGKIATIEVLHFLRKEIKYNNHQDLFSQINQDILMAKEYFFIN
jgi:riboflavin kinase/FMN adenylyltransferase